MKIDELINGIRAVGDSIDVYKYSNKIKVVYNLFVIINIPYDAKNTFDCTFVNQTIEFPAYIKAQLTRVINKFLRTPIKERFPEKKYRLRWIDDDDGASNYLNKVKGVWKLRSMKSTMGIFTEKELQQLKINNPKLAPAIDS